MKSIIVAAGIAAAAISSAQSAPYQLPTNSGVRIGVALALDSSLRDSSSTLFGLGLDLPLNLVLSKDAETILSFDYLTKSSSGGRSTLIPILINARFYGKTPAGMQRSYFFVGAGGALVDVNSANFVLAGRLGVGTEFSQVIYGEASILFSDASAGARANSLGLFIGYRF